MRIAIIGGGVLGLLCGRILKESKGESVSVTIFDSALKGGSQGLRLAGVFWQNLSLRDLMQEGTAWWDKWLQGKEGTHIYRDVYEVFPDVQAREKVVNILEELGVSHSIHSSHELLHCSQPAILYPEAARLLFMDKVLAGLREEFSSLGGELISQNVLNVSEDGGIEYPNGSEAFDQVVLANGAWVQRFSHHFGFKVKATRQNWYEVRGLSECNEGVPFVKDMRNARRILPDGSGFRVFDGNVGEEISPGIEVRDESEVDKLTDYLQDFFPASSPTLVHHSCQYVCTPDYGPVVDRRGALCMLTPPAGGGVKTGPALAAVCVNLILNKGNRIPQFTAKRFNG